MSKVFSLADEQLVIAIAGHSGFYIQISLGSQGQKKGI